MPSSLLMLGDGSILGAGMWLIDLVQYLGAGAATLLALGLASMIYENVTVFRRGAGRLDGMEFSGLGVPKPREQQN